MRKVKSGDLDKLGLLFERYNRRLFGFFYRLTCRRDLSEDLVQEVFERLLRYRHTYSGEGAFGTWLFRIARNLHSDHYRRSNGWPERDEWVDWEEIPADTASPADRIDPDRERTLLRRAIEQLDPVKKQTLLLSRYEGFRYREIAEIMECSESAVKVRIYRAIRELKEIASTLKNEEQSNV